MEGGREEEEGLEGRLGVGYTTKTDTFVRLTGWLFVRARFDRSLAHSHS